MTLSPFTEGAGLVERERTRNQVFGSFPEDSGGSPAPLPGDPHDFTSEPPRSAG